MSHVTLMNESCHTYLATSTWREHIVGAALTVCTTSWKSKVQTSPVSPAKSLTSRKRALHLPRKSRARGAPSRRAPQGHDQIPGEFFFFGLAADASRAKHPLATELHCRKSDLLLVELRLPQLKKNKN